MALWVKWRLPRDLVRKDPNMDLNHDDLQNMMDRILLDCGITTPRVLQPHNVEGGAMNEKGPILMGYIPIKPTVAGNVTRGHIKFPVKELSVYETKLAAFFRARLHQQMPDSPTLASQVTLRLDARNGPAERSEMFVVGFDETWLVQDKVHDCPITGHHLSAESNWISLLA